MEKPTPVRLWNPSAAAGWSLILSPVFGAWIQAKNWQELGRPEEARKSMGWVYGGAAYFCLLLATSGIVTTRETSPLGMIFFAAWYVTSGLAQVKLVKEGLAYEKKSWTKPLLIGFGALAVIFALAVGIAIARQPSVAQRLETASVAVVTRIVKEQLHGTSACKSVQVVETLPDGVYRAVATMEDGKTLPVTLRTKDGRFTVEIPRQ